MESTDSVVAMGKSRGELAERPPWIVRILRKGANSDKFHVVGAGFLTDEHHVLTCAHVVAAALGLPGDTQTDDPDFTAAVQLDFPACENASRIAHVLPKSVWNGARPEKWRRLHPEKPAYTLLANMHRDLSEFAHPCLNRWITVREAARLQSFHDGFVFVGSEWQQLKQVGNAVPPLLGRAMALVATSLLDAIATSGDTGRRVQSPLQTVLSFAEPT